MSLLLIREAVDRLAWKRVPELMLEFYEKSAGVAEKVRALELADPVYYNPDRNILWSMGTHDFMKLAQIRDVDMVLVDQDQDPGTPADRPQEPWVKLAGSDALQGLLEATNYFPNRLNAKIPGLQSPLGAMLTSGLIGGGLGYAGGAALEQLLPEQWEKKRLRRSLALMGGIGAALPAGVWGAINSANDKSWLDGWPFDDAALPNNPPDSPRTYEPIFGNPPSDAPPKFTRKFANYELSPPSETGLSTRPLINVNEFNQTIWGDQRVAGHLSPLMQAASTGLVSGAATLAGGGGQAKLITPWDVGRMAAGMGSGFLSGALVGKALGVLMGMPQPTQERLKQTGLWAGVVANMVPLAFGGSR